MDVETFKALEFLLIFGVVFVFLFWQFFATDKVIKEREAREREEAEAGEVGAPTEPD